MPKLQNIVTVVGLSFAVALVMRTTDTVPDTTKRRVLSGISHDMATMEEPEAAKVSDVGKHELPHRPGEPRFAPQAYYYAASRSGVIPSWVAPTP